MDLELCFETLSRRVPGLRLVRGESMSEHTSFRIGGPAALFAEPEGEAQLLALLDALRETGAESLVLGRGTNLLVRDGGLAAVVIHLGEGFAGIRADGERIYAQAGASLAAVASAALREGLTGMEFAHGIPGSLGGGVLMNAGAYGGEMKDIVESVRYVDADGNVRETSDCGFAYRRSRFEEERSVILGATLRLARGEREEIAGLMKSLSERRVASQPLDKPSAGSTFKRPREGYAAAMIDQCGLKGFSVGGAQVSPKHAGFVVNAGGASCADVEALMEHVQREVFARFGVLLEPEVKIVG